MAPILGFDATGDVGRAEDIASKVCRRGIEINDAVSLIRCKFQQNIPKM